jgi:DNA-binding MarR family transcriptional regulator
MSELPSAGPTERQLMDAVRALARLSRTIEFASQELSPSEYRVMSSIVGGEQRASRLANRLALGKPAISATVDSLSKRGLVIRSSVEGDNRATALSLSDDGAKLFHRMEGRMMRQLELLAERTPDPVRVVESLARLGEVIEEAMVARAAATEAEK